MIVVVGERFNIGRRWRPRDEGMETNLRLLLRLGAFRKGKSRRCLVKHGLKWDRSMNLLMPHDRGEWDASRAKEVASEISSKLEEEFDSIVLCGRRVAKAFSVEGDFLDRVGRYLLCPHPSGLNHWWNDEGNRRRARETFSETVSSHYEGGMS